MAAACSMAARLVTAIVTSWMRGNLRGRECEKARRAQLQAKAARVEVEGFARATLRLRALDGCACGRAAACTLALDASIMTTPRMS